MSVEGGIKEGQLWMRVWWKLNLGLRGDGAGSQNLWKLPENLCLFSLGTELTSCLICDGRCDFSPPAD